MAAFGYRHDEIEALKKVSCAEDVKVSQLFQRTIERPPVAVSLGCHLVGSLLPHADPSDADTLAMGVKGRMGKIMPVVENRSEFLLGLREYTLKWIKRKNLVPLSCNFDGSIETWLSRTNYPEWRKVELRKYKDKIEDLLRRNKHGELMYFTVKLFMKDEHYVDFKHARGIYARDDAAKLFFGPWFKGIEDQIYSLGEFIKHVPVRDRARYIYEKLYVQGSKYIATDYSSYEAHFVADLMANCEFILYEYMLGGFGAGQEVLSIMKEVLMGNNRIFNKYLSVSCKARRMSGEMNTSLGNGFSNLMFMGYVCEQLGLPEPNGVVEGDDGLFQFLGRHPTTEDFAKYGFLIKLDAYAKISDASFCGNLFDEDSLQIVTDPRDVISSFGWTTARYRHSNSKKLGTLLRCKALSFAHQYPGCPMVGALSQYALRVTRGRTQRDLITSLGVRKDVNMWEREQLEQAIRFSSRDEDLYESPTMGTRLLFEELYQVPVSTQLKFENYINNLSSIQPLKFDLLVDVVPKSWTTYYNEYVFNFDKIPEKMVLPNRTVT